MAGRKRYRGTGLLAIIFVLISAPLSAEDGEGPRVLIHYSPERPVAGSNWILSLLISHSEPNEVNILEPPFTAPLFLDHALKGPRMVNPAVGQIVTMPAVTEEDGVERWTVMEYRFVLHGFEPINFNAFTVITPHGETKTIPFGLRVERPRNMTDAPRPRLTWEEIPRSARTGESAVFSLRAGGWNQAALPEAGLFMPPVPPGHILESLPLSMEEKSEGIALKLRLIPLEAVPFVLVTRRFSQDGIVFEIPALQIPVAPASTDGKAVQAAPEETNEDGREKSDSPPPFPLLEPAINGFPGFYQKYRAECESVYAAAKNFWEQGRRADALAVLRQNERDHPAGAFFAVTRREAERNIGLTGTNDEKGRNILSFLRKTKRSAILKETQVRRIPDSAGEEIARFREGQPVLLSSENARTAAGKASGGTQGRHESWLRVIGNDNDRASGWIPEENIIFY